ncbi:MAG: hypothetical protein EZS28_003756 [Streblomastix strix]|uniref:Uncharacterized protein n=1 Tax=Streblomastix strix TaxID=222440 RepID=A0A5J4X1W1_9EUKA|nr:MAG: hypothetical protein EZS28_003756 [Streblomastix strix]
MKLDTNGVMTLKNINLLNNDFLSKITTLEQEVNEIQQTVGTATQDIGGLQQQINVINDELNRYAHFRGYNLLNTDIQQLANSANGDFAFSAESGTVWMYDADWYNSGNIVPDQVTPASDAIPLVDSGTEVAGTSTKYSHRDHKHPLQVFTVLPSKDTSVGEVETATTYARSDHTHHVNLSSNVPLKDTGTGTAGTDNVYASATHQHPINVDPSSVNVPLVNATAAANGRSDYYSRNDHVHLQQLTYTGLLTSTMFIKNGAQATDVLLANADSKPITDIAGDGFVVKTGKTLQAVQGVLRHSGDDEESDDDEDYITRGVIYNQYDSKASPDTIVGRKIFKNDYFQLQPASTTNPLILFKNNNNLIEQLINSNEISLTMNITDPVGTPLYINYRGTSLTTQYPNSKIATSYVLNTGNSTSFAGVKCGLVQIKPNGNNFNEGLRISRSSDSNYSGIYLGCNPNSICASLTNQWNIVNTPIGELRIGVSDQLLQDNKGLEISTDGNSLSFNRTVIAGAGEQSGASNGSINYSAGNPIL